jgi:hypothetical protein
MRKNKMIQARSTIHRITTKDASRVDDLLNLAVDKNIPDALALNHGI